MVSLSRLSAKHLFFNSTLEQTMEILFNSYLPVNRSKIVSKIDSSETTQEKLYIQNSDLEIIIEYMNNIIYNHLFIFSEKFHRFINQHQSPSSHTEF